MILYLYSLEEQLTFIIKHGSQIFLREPDCMIIFIFIHYCGTVIPHCATVQLEEAELLFWLEWVEFPLNWHWCIVSSFFYCICYDLAGVVEGDCWAVAVAIAVVVALSMASFRRKLGRKSYQFRVISDVWGYTVRFFPSIKLIDNLALVVNEPWKISF